MKKLAMMMLMAMVINFSYPLAPIAHAASVEDQLAKMATQNSTVSRVQELLKAKQALEQGDQTALLGMVSQAALQKLGNSPLTAIASSGSVSGAVETTIRQKIVQDLGSQLAPYQKELAVLSTLLNLNAQLTPQSVKDSNSLLGAPQNYKKVFSMTATAYGPGMLDNGRWDNLTYMGGTVKKGVAAVDPSVIPMGSKLWIEGYGEAIAEDQGSAIKGNRIDLAFNNRQEALDYGINPVKVYILN
jgi:3D (Asp-Asp-Asp) domain-containing protein